MIVSCDDNPVDNSNTSPNDPDPPQEKLNDYFPLTTGNWWLYNYDFKPMASEDIWWKGNIKWEVEDSISTEDSTIFKITETINGIVIEGNPINTDLDTTVISDSMSTLYFVEKKDGYIKMDKNFYFGNRVSIEINRYYPDSLKYLSFDSYYSPPFTADSNIIHSYYTGHLVRLRKNVGIVEWKIDNTSNNSPEGKVWLEEYNLIE